MGVLPSMDVGWNAAMRAVATNAFSRAVLPDPLGPMSTTAEGRRISGLAVLRRNRGSSGVVAGIRRSRTTFSRIEQKLDTEKV